STTIGDNRPFATLMGFAHGEALLVTGGEDGTVRVWDPQTRVGKILTRHDGRLNTLAISADDRWVASGGIDHSVRLSSTDGRKVIALQGHLSDVMSVTFSRDGHLLASTSLDRTARIWSLGPVIDGAPVPSLTDLTSMIIDENQIAASHN